MSVEHRVTIDHWTHPRLPSTHHLSDRWSIMFRGRALLTVSTANEAIETARQNGWTVARTASEVSL